MNLHFKFSLLLVSLFISFLGFNQVSFAVSYSGNCAPVTVTFNNTSTIGDHYDWYFGDGNYLNDVANPTHTYTSPGQYYVDLYAYDVNWNYLGNSYELITIGGGPNSINFSYGVDTHCSNDLINMYIPANGNSFNWDFGDGTSLVTGNYAEHSYTSSGQHIVTVSYEDPGCGFITVQDTVYIVNNAPYFASTNPYPGFYVSATQICPGDQVSGGLYGGYSSVLWDFGNGNTSTLDYPNWNYLNVGTYQVSVNLTNGCGIDTTLFQSINVDLSTPVSTPGIYLPDTVCPGELFSFYVYSQSAEEDLLVYMGDNSDTLSSTTYNWLEHSYSAVGTYIISYTVTNSCGNSMTVTDSIVVDSSSPINNPYFSFPDSICPGEQFYFYAGAQGAQNVYYSMGDLSDTIISPAGNYASHTYITPGTYYVSVTIVNSCGNSITVFDSIAVSNSAPVLNPYLYVSPLNICPGDQINFNTNYEYDVFVDFGDGFNTTQDYGFHTYSLPGTYEVMTIIQNQCGSSTTLTETVTVANNIPINPNNIYAFGYPNIACPSTSINLYATAGYQSYVWNFGDGLTGTGQEINHLYNVAGIYNVNVVITNGCGSSASASTVVEIQNNLPITNFSISQPIDSICLGNTLFMQAQNNSGINYSWDMGDGTLLNGAGITHEYQDYGTYTISVTATNTCGNDSTIYATVVVTDDYVMGPGDVFAYVQQEGCIGDENMFVIIPSGAGDVFWDFGDGNTSSQVESVFVQGIANVDVTSHIYSSPGSYMAKYTITNACGNSYTDSIPVQIGAFGDNIQYNIDIIYDETETICQGQPFEFMAIGGGTYIWNFGDQSGNLVTETSLSPVEHIYEEAGYYTVTLTSISGCGQTVTETEGIFVPESKINVITNTVTNATCSVNNGVAVVTANGGAPPYTFQWSNGAEGVIANNLNSGIYVVTVTDLNQCSNEGIATVSDQEGAVILVDNISHVDCYGASNGSISVTILGGQPPYDISWSNGDQTEDIYGLVAGPYEIFVTDANGCFSVESIEVTQPAKTNISVLASKAPCGGVSGLVSATINSGTAPYFFIWPNASGPNSQTSGLTPGFHNLLVIDGNTCLLEKMFVVDEIGGPIIVLDSINTGTCDGDLSDIYIKTIGGQGPFTYNWSNGSTNKDLISVIPGAYTVQVTSSNGCSSYEFFTVEETTPDKVEICMVDVDSITNTNLVIWSPLNDPTVSYYNIYKESSEAGLYYFVGSTSGDSLSQYYDYDSDPRIRSWKYKVSAVDNCGNEGALSVQHKTMHLTSNFGLNNSINLIWDTYVGFSYSSYYINRYHPSTGWIIIDTVPSSAFTYTDQNVPGDSNLIYMISIPSPNNCLPVKAQDYNSSRSNKRGINVAVEDDEEPIGAVNEIDASFSIYPNPTNSIIKVVYSERIEEIEIRDVTGKIVLKEKNNSSQFEADLSHFESGVYFISIITSHNQLVGKIIKE
jgi:PKD repeat protein